MKEALPQPEQEMIANTAASLHHCITHGLRMSASYDVFAVGPTAKAVAKRMIILDEEGGGEEDHGDDNCAEKGKCSVVVIDRVRFFHM